ncbi:MAG: hypothetical protein HYU63_02330 [Armatimonadetes bacterium]|nr:hypothetical protein [Armatimonadota bacterium]
MSDKSMHKLISIMNEIPYIETFSCCGGHPEESAVEGLKWAIANIHFEIKEEQYNLFKWYSLIETILLERKKLKPKYSWGFIVEKQFLLEDNFLIWRWTLKVEVEGETYEKCQSGLEEGVKFLSDIFEKEAKKELERCEV